jgi:protein O-mannosyl-transferase
MSKRKISKSQPPRKEVSRKGLFNWAPPALVGIVTFIAFSPALKNGFVWDDTSNLLENLKYRGLGWNQLRWMFSTFHLGHYQPLSWVTFGLDYQL